MREVFGSALLAVDVAMAGGVEDTRESTALVRVAEDLAAEAWGGERCFFLVNGSTSGIHSLLLALAGPGDGVILPRNAHKSVQAALIFSGAVPHYVEPAIDPLWGIPLNVPAERVAAAVEAHPEAKAVFVVSPNSNGVCAALDAIAAVAHGGGLPLVVDQAWGPHLRFCSRLPLDAMSAGADAMVASTHKLISGLTQSSVLVARGGRLRLRRLESIVKMTQSTSPQVLIYASIDAARAQMATQGEELWSQARRQRRLAARAAGAAAPACACCPTRSWPRRAWPTSTARASRCRPATWASPATSSRRRCATTTASPSRPPTR